MQNVTEYKVNKSKKARVSRLITRGAAIECICKDVELLDKAEFFLLAERIFSDPVLCDEIAKMVVGRRDCIEAVSYTHLYAEIYFVNSGSFIDCRANKTRRKVCMVKIVFVCHGTL